METPRKQERIKIAKINWVYQENRSNHHRIKYQALELYDKNWMKEAYKKVHQEHTKYINQKGKFTLVIFINEALAKMSQKRS